MKKEKKEFDNEALNIIHKKMQFLNYADSFGTIVLKNGTVLQVSSFFEYFKEYWGEYKTAVALEDKNALKDLLNEISGGILSNGEIDIDIKEVVAMISIYKVVSPETKKKIFPHTNKHFFEKREQNITDDNIGEYGDSFLFGN